MATGFLMFCAAIHSSASRFSARPAASCCSTPIRRLVTAVQLHVGAIERAAASWRRRARAEPSFEVREASLEQEGDRIGPRHALARARLAAVRAAARNRRRGPLRRHGQPAASVQVQRFDPQDLDPPEIGAAEDAIQVLEQAPRQRASPR